MNFVEDEYEPELYEPFLAANYLVNNLQFNKWPQYYRILLLCLSPRKYKVRYYQIQFCIINRIPFEIYVWLLVLNHNFDPTNTTFINKLRNNFEYVYNYAARHPTKIHSYSINVDGVIDFMGDSYFRAGRDDFIEHVIDYDSIRGELKNEYCNPATEQRHLINLNVIDMISIDPTIHSMPHDPQVYRALYGNIDINEDEINEFQNEM